MFLLFTLISDVKSAGGGKTVKSAIHILVALTVLVTDHGNVIVRMVGEECFAMKVSNYPFPSHLSI